MALDNYSNLQTSIANWLARDDLTVEIPDFIALCEAEFNRELRIRSMETTETVTIDAEQEALPTGFLGVRSFFLNKNHKAHLFSYLYKVYDKINITIASQMPLSWNLMPRDNPQAINPTINMILTFCCKLITYRSYSI